MGRSSSRRAGASGRQPPPAAVTHPIPPGAPAAPDLSVAALKTYEGRLGALSAIGDRLVNGDPGENEQRALAAALRAIRLAREEVAVEDQVQALRDLATQIAADRAERAAMESGVQRASQAPQLPSVRGRGTH